MKKTFKIITMLLLVLVTSTFVFAQQSNTFIATAGTLRDDADNFMDVRYFNDVDFSNFFVMTNLSLGGANLGFAKKSNDFYFGSYYSGDLWGFSFLDKNVATDSGEITYFNKTIQNFHEFDLFFGFSGMALKLDTNFNINTTYTDANYNKNSDYYFALTWGGLSIPVGNANIRPYATVGYSIYDATTYEETDVLGVTTKITDKSANENVLSVMLASDVEWGDKSGFFSVAGLQYALYLGIGLNGDVSESVVTTDGTTTTSVTKRDGASYTTNYIAPYYRFEYTASDKVKFGGRVGATVDITTYCAGLTYTDTPSVDTPSVDTYFLVYSNLAFGMQYKLKPEFAMNVGVGANLPTFYSQKTVDVTLNDTASSIYTYGIDTTIYTGFVWDINENCALDASMNIGLTPAFLDDILNGSLTLGFKYKK